MHKHREELLQFIWEYKLLKPLPLITRSGTEVFVLNPGQRNDNAGPDFFNARIRINGVILAGNIEIHKKTSDWLRHNHQQNRSYDTIILHVVYEHDMDLFQNTAHHVEVLELKDLIDSSTLEHYNDLGNKDNALACGRQLRYIEDITFINWLERMTFDRLEEKVKRIENWFKRYNSDYTQTFYTLVLRSFGTNINALPFELLGKQLPLQLLLKHSDNLQQLEALLLGTAGLLEDHVEDVYIRKLQNEFEFLKHKYGLMPLQKELFKFSRMRPANFPTLRLAQFAMLIYKNKSLLESPHSYTQYNVLMKALSHELQGYWKNHYTCEGKELPKRLSLGESTRENLIINVFAPFFFFYAKRSARPEYADMALELLNACKPEYNVKTKHFISRKHNFLSAADSQGLIHLFDTYCSAGECLRCGIAAAVLSRPVKNEAVTTCA